MTIIVFGTPTDCSPLPSPPHKLHDMCAPLVGAHRGSKVKLFPPTIIYYHGYKKVYRSRSQQDNVAESEGPEIENRDEENPMLQQILERMETIQQQNQQLQQQNQQLQTRVNSLSRGQYDGEDLEGALGDFHPFSTEIANTILQESQHGEQENRGRRWYQGHFGGEGVGGTCRSTSLTPLNTTRARILKKVYQSNLIKLPPPGEGVKGSDADKCLGQYVQRKWSEEGSSRRQYDSMNEDFKKRRDDDRDQKDKDEGVRGVVTTIAGGFDGGGETSLARRSYVSRYDNRSRCRRERDRYPVICFSQRDFEGIQPHQDDPMVIEVSMAKYKVQRVLVDQGSSTDILYWEAFKKLQIPSDWLLPLS
ncbi:hypothetical protein SESBI_21393 [Sesbania bispinosa]|nr:hypothetical protein SESBI_21393 [Sesbania bispinosa]